MGSPGAQRPLLRALLVLTVLSAGAIFWLAPRPPMGDLCEHAAQVALLRDLMAGTSPWGDLVRVNWFTPYLLGYGLAFLLSFAMPIVAALKLTLTLAYYGFVLSCVMLRRAFRGDERLDWLFVPGFFGFSFQYGFFTFLVAAPIGLLFLLLAKRFAARFTLWGGVQVLCAGVVLFFSHGLVFLFAGAIGLAFVLLAPQRFVQKWFALTPYLLLGVLCLAYFFYAVRRTDPLMSIADHRPTIDWGWATRWGWHRAFNFVLFVFASNGSDMPFFAAGLAMLAAPWLLPSRIKRRDPASWTAMVVVVFIWFLVPATALKTDFLYQRFAIFLLPAYALMFAPAEDAGPTKTTGMRAGLVQVGLVVLCWSFLGVVAVRQRRFIAESASFEELLAVTEPQQRALGLVYDPASVAVRNPYTFHVHPVWYEVEKKGFVDFQFRVLLAVADLSDFGPTGSLRWCRASTIPPRPSIGTLCTLGSTGTSSCATSTRCPRGSSRTTSAASPCGRKRASGRCTSVWSAADGGRLRDAGSAAGYRFVLWAMTDLNCQPTD